MPAIEVSGLSKTFRSYKKQPGFAGALKGLVRREYEHVAAVSDIRFKIEPGEFVGFLGPNGAGKTTTLRMAVGLADPDKGSIHIYGIDARREPRKAKAITARLEYDTTICSKCQAEEWICKCSEKAEKKK